MNHFLVGDGNPVGHVEFVGFGIVETSDLLSEQLDHEGVEIETLEEAEGFSGAALAGVALGRASLRSFR